MGSKLGRLALLAETGVTRHRQVGFGWRSRRHLQACCLWSLENQTGSSGKPQACKQMFQSDRGTSAHQSRGKVKTLPRLYQHVRDGYKLYTAGVEVSSWTTRTWQALDACFHKWLPPAVVPTRGAAGPWSSPLAFALHSFHHFNECSEAFLLWWSLSAQTLATGTNGTAHPLLCPFTFSRTTSHSNLGAYLP